MKIWCSYITVDFAMAASQNSVGITQQSTSVEKNNNLVSHLLYDKRLKIQKSNVFDIF
jgi:hypothetical protein